MMWIRAPRRELITALRLDIAMTPWSGHWSSNQKQQPAWSLRDLLNKNSYQRDTETVILCATAERHFTVIKITTSFAKALQPCCVFSEYIVLKAAGNSSDVNEHRHHTVEDSLCCGHSIYNLLSIELFLAFLKTWQYEKNQFLFSLWSLPKKPVCKDAFSSMYSLATMNHA